MGAMLLTQFIGAFYGLLAVILGAFGAHALKRKLTPELLHSFETGVKYQMYHALLLLMLGFNLSFDQPLDLVISHCFIFGTLLFSFSIYGLCLSAATGKKLRILGPITPIGGLLLVIGWVLLLYSFTFNLI